MLKVAVQKDAEVSDSKSNEEASDESIEIHEPSDDTTVKLNTSEEDNKQVKGED